jgi:hypothetical protein
MPECLRVGVATDVVPQHCPLVLALPHVRTLEQRDQQTLRHEEHLMRRSDLGLHTSSRMVLTMLIP